MPIYQGIGLHDASWRKKFGGNIYQSDGSHGCINLPRPVAEFTYNNYPSGTIVICH
jgi:lipoprotein-anchoring transpeptidase ErfK/SrfK